MARTVDKVRDEEKIGLSQNGTLEYSSGRMIALNPKTNERPITKVLLESNLQLSMIWIPEMTIKQVTNITIAPIIEAGIIENIAVSFGMNAIPTKRNPA